MHAVKQVYGSIVMTNRIEMLVPAEWEPADRAQYNKETQALVLTMATLDWIIMGFGRRDGTMIPLVFVKANADDAPGHALHEARDYLAAGYV